ncbi:helix-turn-helix domain-containing protein, partial [Thermovenabulum sp.]
ASSNEDPKMLIEKGLLRQDLFYRLHVISFYIPPLRERKEDIPVLIEHFLNHFNKKLNKKIIGIKEDALTLLVNYQWPGNVRELRSVIENIANFTDNSLISTDDIPDYIKSLANTLNYQKYYMEVPENIQSLKEMVETFEKNLIICTLQKVNGNLSKASRILKIPKQTLHNKIKKYNIKKKIDFS